jgi:uncharacterized protein YchJ
MISCSGQQLILAKKLEILAATLPVNFKAYFIDQNRVPQIHHELSNFVREWFVVLC